MAKHTNTSTVGFYAGLNLIAWFMIFCFVRETKQLTLEEIDRKSQQPASQIKFPKNTMLTSLSQRSSKSRPRSSSATSSPFGCPGSSRPRSCVRTSRSRPPSSAPRKASQTLSSTRCYSPESRQIKTRTIYIASLRYIYTRGNAFNEFHSSMDLVYNSVIGIINLPPYLNLFIKISIVRFLILKSFEKPTCRAAVSIVERCGHHGYVQQGHACQQHQRETY